MIAITYLRGQRFTFYFFAFFLFLDFPILFSKYNFILKFKVRYCFFNFDSSTISTVLAYSEPPHPFHLLIPKGFFRPQAILKILIKIRSRLLIKAHCRF